MMVRGLQGQGLWRSLPGELLVTQSRAHTWGRQSWMGSFDLKLSQGGVFIHPSGSSPVWGSTFPASVQCALLGQGLGRGEHRGAESLGSTPHPQSWVSQQDAAEALRRAGALPASQLGQTAPGHHQLNRGRLSL